MLSLDKINDCVLCPPASLGHASADTVTTLVSLAVIRDDLREIRYYYFRKEKFDEAFKLMPSSVIEIVEKARRYNEAVKAAPVRLNVM